MSFCLAHTSGDSFNFDLSCDCECHTDDDESNESCDMDEFNQDSCSYKNFLTKVSQFLAFDLMPDLNVNIIYGHLH